MLSLSKTHRAARRVRTIGSDGISATDIAAWRDDTASHRNHPYRFHRSCRTRRPARRLSVRAVSPRSSSQACSTRSQHAAAMPRRPERCMGSPFLVMCNRRGRAEIGVGAQAAPGRDRHRDCCAQLVLVAGEMEITLEANPGSSETGRFACYRAAGVNRISIGRPGPRRRIAQGARRRSPLALSAHHRARYAFCHTGGPWRT